MSDRRTRDLEQKARSEGTPESVANFLRARVREDADDLKLLGILSPFVLDVRRKALQLMVDLPDDRQVLLEAMFILEEQIDHALQFAIQPRKGDALLPDRNAILRSIHQILTPEQARIFLDREEVQEPRLVLVPIASGERYFDELSSASQIVEGSIRPSIDPGVQARLRDQAIQAQVEGNKIKKWKFAITEGARIFPSPQWDNHDQTFAQRIERFNQRYTSKKIRRLDGPSYISLMIQGLGEGKPMDCKYTNDSREGGYVSQEGYHIRTESWQGTLLDEVDTEAGTVGSARWDSKFRNVRMSSADLNFRFGLDRMRLALIGDISECEF